MSDEEKGSKVKSDERFIYTMGVIFLVIMGIGMYLILSPSIEENNKIAEEFKVVNEYYSDNDEIVDRIERSRTGVGHNYKSYFPNGEIHYLKVDGKNVNVVLKIEEVTE